jgi:Zn-finger nucleic acid-binding protein
MNCPTCNVPLVISERLNVEIDYCPDCRGVWLDRGELDKIVERSNREERGAPREFERAEPYRKKKRESFLGELFDF